MKAYLMLLHQETAVPFSFSYYNYNDRLQPASQERGFWFPSSLWGHADWRRFQMLRIYQTQTPPFLDLMERGQHRSRNYWFCVDTYMSCNHLCSFCVSMLIKKQWLLPVTTDQPSSLTVLLPPSLSCCPGCCCVAMETACHMGDVAVCLAGANVVLLSRPQAARWRTHHWGTWAVWGWCGGGPHAVGSGTQPTPTWTFPGPTRVSLGPTWLLSHLM